MTQKGSAIKKNVARKGVFKWRQTVLNFKLDAVGISDEIVVKNCTILLKPRLAELEEFLMIQLSQATADFLTRKIIQYFSCAAQGYVADQGTQRVRKMPGCSGLRN